VLLVHYVALYNLNQNIQIKFGKIMMINFNLFKTKYLYQYSDYIILNLLILINRYAEAGINKDSATIRKRVSS
jgi:hypothetical protein